MQILKETPTLQRFEVTYSSAGHTISGTLTRPTGNGPFPAVVSNHGYLPPGDYQVGNGLATEELELAEAGFVVLHPDYRGYGLSDPLLPFEQELRLVYTQDVVNAADALTTLAFVDPTRLALLGRSMGGALAINALVTHPGLVQAAVVYAPLSSDFLEGSALLDRLGPETLSTVLNTFGTPESAPDFYRGLSSRYSFDKITEPLLIQHGTADRTCPLRWSEKTQRLLVAAGITSELVEWPGEDHVFVRSAGPALARTIAFLRDKLDLPPS
ncbi:S9 family peptidase [Nocardioides sp.]|uniref:alpha/beta hydrolase family protein n=1 Tax=Nocardioides sp. TaxID=35761 RepID=UPI00272051FF|nr:alpha/beta fold hydrolase [Nocardioides sp.]MDO9454652.1 alpha/beta fold hydrolase [Nocardioides sp.]